MNEVISDLQQDFPKPYLVTWVLHCGYLLFFALFLPILWLVECIRGNPPIMFTFNDLLWAALFNVLILSSDYLWVLALSSAEVLPALTSVCAAAAVVLFVRFVDDAPSSPSPWR